MDQKLQHMRWVGPTCANGEAKRVIGSIACLFRAFIPVQDVDSESKEPDKKGAENVGELLHRIFLGKDGPDDSFVRKVLEEAVDEEYADSELEEVADEDYADSELESSDEEGYQE